MMDIKDDQLLPLLLALLYGTGVAVTVSVRLDDLLSSADGSFCVTYAPIVIIILLAALNMKNPGLPELPGNGDVTMDSLLVMVIGAAATAIVLGLTNTLTVIALWALAMQVIQPDGGFDSCADASRPSKSQGSASLLPTVDRPSLRQRRAARSGFADDLSIDIDILQTTYGGGP